MSEHGLSPGISRRTLLRSGAAVAAAAAGLSPSSCATGRAQGTGATGRAPGTGATERPQGTGATGRGPEKGPANVRVSHDHYGVHVEPSVAANPRHPGQLLAACQVSPTANPQFIASYLSSDGGATWHSGGLPQVPAGAPKNGDDVTVAFDSAGRGYVCATSYATHTNRGVYVWRTDDGGRSFSAPVTLVAGQYCDHPWVATGTGQASSQRNVYVVWAAGTGSALRFTRSTDGGKSFEAPRMILGDDGVSVLSAGPALAAGAHGLVCAVSDRRTHFDSSGDVVSEVIAVCSADGGRSFAGPVRLGSESPVISLPGGVKPDGSPAVAAAPGGDALYAAFTRHQPGAIHSDIMVTASHDGGRTWVKARPATPADSVTYFQPNLTVDAAGQVAISAFALANGRVNQVLLLSRPRQLRFRPPLQITTAPFDPHSPTAGGKHGAWWIGDYQGITTSAGAVLLVWNDTRTGKLDLFAATVHP